jgi:hypothetical protein
MRDKDAHLIFESYLNQKTNKPILEADGKKWEDESSAWAWLKVFDPTGFSSYPDVLDSIYEVKDSDGKDIIPWLKFIFNIFLALPNIGLLTAPFTAGVGAVGWQGLRGAIKGVVSKGVAKGSEREMIVLSEKLLNIARESKPLTYFFKKTISKLTEKGAITPEISRSLLEAFEKGSIEGITKKEFKKGALTAVQKADKLNAAMDASGGIGKMLKSEIGPKELLSLNQPYKTGLRATTQLGGAATNWFEDDFNKREQNKSQSGPTKEKAAELEKQKTSELPSIKRKEETKPSQSSTPKPKKKYGDEFPEL